MKAYTTVVSTCWVWGVGVKDEFILLVLGIFKENKWSCCQSKGVLTLLFKRGESEHICNWRSSTLRNTYYKLIANILAERLNTVLPNLTDSDQKGWKYQRCKPFNTGYYRLIHQEVRGKYYIYCSKRQKDIKHKLNNSFPMSICKLPTFLYLQ